LRGTEIRLFSKDKIFVGFIDNEKQPVTRGKFDERARFFFGENRAGGIIGITIENSARAGREAASKRIYVERKFCSSRNGAKRGVQPAMRTTSWYDA
jgi:hypothetical protein